MVDFSVVKLVKTGLAPHVPPRQSRIFNNSLAKTVVAFARISQQCFLADIR